MSRPVLVSYREASRLEPYAAALTAAGCEIEVERTSATQSAARWLQGMSGLMLTGGGDVDPALYGEARHVETEDPDGERDAEEMELLREALALDLPVLAICRGLQVLNVYQGGTLVQHLPTSARHVRRDGERSAPAHEVRIEPDTLLSEIVGSPTAQVNSRHHQAIGVLGKGLRVSARDVEDGIIEAVELPGRSFVLAVQWHPEDQAPCAPEQFRIFESFADACVNAPAFR